MENMINVYAECCRLYEMAMAYRALNQRPTALLYLSWCYDAYNEYRALGGLRKAPYQL